MKPKFSLYTLLWIVFFGAVLSAFYADYRWKSSLTNVVVTSRNLDICHKITEDDVEVRDCLASRVPEGAITEISHVLGKLIVNRKTRNSPIFISELVDEGKGLGGGDLAREIVSITVKNLERFDLKPGERVSVYATDKCLLESVRIWDLGSEPNTLILLVDPGQKASV